MGFCKNIPTETVLLPGQKTSIFKNTYKTLLYKNCGFSRNTQMFGSLRGNMVWKFWLNTNSPEIFRICLGFGIVSKRYRPIVSILLHYYIFLTPMISPMCKPKTFFHRIRNYSKKPVSFTPNFTTCHKPGHHFFLIAICYFS